VKHFVAKVSDIGPGDRLIVNVAGRSIGIFNLDGEFFALRNQCPHAGAPVCLGLKTSLVRSTLPGHFECSRTGEILRCPWHDWEFDIKTGKSIVDPGRLKIPSYPTAVMASGDEVATLPPTGRDADGKPFELETYPVSVEAHYVVVDV